MANCESELKIIIGDLKKLGMPSPIQVRLLCTEFYLIQVTFSHIVSIRSGILSL